jgi:hypothetical protein
MRMLERGVKESKKPTKALQPLVMSTGDVLRSTHNGVGLAKVDRMLFDT